MQLVQGHHLTHASKKLQAIVKQKKFIRNRQAGQQARHVQCHRRLTGNTRPAAAGQIGRAAANLDLATRNGVNT
ncbi:hypothetical protein [Vogesella sp. XCS3]|uniref:hypothetical protein n=1 Tax=Vogesella sp. XCS3 TaxID=2877939 RepID=UPI001D0A8A1F|nr:hypothetical protein [Vogesella sp. XCS3]UDM17496.1 hypothetical protein LCH97_02130 [Vogesella sp. XCS3]